MQITIVGTGNMARGIASRALAGGHDVTLVGSERSKAEALAGELGAAGGSGAVQARDAPAGVRSRLSGPPPALAGPLEAQPLPAPRQGGVGAPPPAGLLPV